MNIHSKPPSGKPQSNRPSHWAIGHAADKRRQAFLLDKQTLRFFRETAMYKYVCNPRTRQLAIGDYEGQHRFIAQAVFRKVIIPGFFAGLIRIERLEGKAARVVIFGGSGHYGVPNREQVAIAAELLAGYFAEPQIIADRTNTMIEGELRA